MTRLAGAFLAILSSTASIPIAAVAQTTGSGEPFQAQVVLSSDGRGAASGTVKVPKGQVFVVQSASIARSGTVVGTVSTIVEGTYGGHTADFVLPLLGSTGNLPGETQTFTLYTRERVHIATYYDNASTQEADTVSVSGYLLPLPQN